MQNTISKPYQIKGTAIKNLKNYINSKVVDDYYETIAQNLGFKNSKLILASTWYPMEFLERAQKMAAQKMGVSTRTFTIDSSIYILENDLNGVYRFFLKFAGASNLLNRVP